jgi:hypothetical protein
MRWAILCGETALLFRSGLFRAHNRGVACQRTAGDSDRGSPHPTNERHSCMSKQPRTPHRLKSMDFFSILIFVAVWLLLNRYLLPKLGVPT